MNILADENVSCCYILGKRKKNLRMQNEANFEMCIAVRKKTFIRKGENHYHLENDVDFKFTFQGKCRMAGSRLLEGGVALQLIQLSECSR